MIEEFKRRYPVRVKTLLRHPSKSFYIVRTEDEFGRFISEEELSDYDIMIMSRGLYRLLLE